MWSSISTCLLLVGLAHGAVTSGQANNRFPDDFLFGAATAAYQVEGGWNAEGKGESIWDRMFHEHPEYSQVGQNGDVACDSYHLYKEDVKLLKELGVTMYHWDLPQWLQDLGGWTNPIIADYFEDYARVLYENFGDRVKWWITLNEPASFVSGYAARGGLAPSVKAPGVGDYLAIHHLLIAHARAYHLYDEKFRATQQGKVGITLNTEWYEPLTNSTEDIAAASRGLQFSFGFYAHPIFSSEGDYPPIVREIVDRNSKAEGRPRSRLPVFSKEMVEYIKGTHDFLGLSYYSTKLITSGETGDNPSMSRDSGIVSSQDPSWPASPVTPWLKVVPWGFRKLINWVDQTYNSPIIFITENGYSDEGTLQDTDRTNYFKSHLTELLKAIHEDGCKVAGYTAWSLIDDLEWLVGFRDRFGLHYVNFSDPARPRTAKASTQFLKEVFRTREIPDEYLN